MNDRPRRVTLCTTNQGFTHHVARGLRTLCGIELAGVTVPDPPGYDAGKTPTCEVQGCGEPFRLARLQSGEPT